MQKPPHFGPEGWCPVSPDEEHHLDLDSIRLADGGTTDGPGHVLFDVWCSCCSQSGSFSVDLTGEQSTLQWGAAEDGD